MLNENSQEEKVMALGEMPSVIEELQQENKLTSEYSKLKASAKIEFDGETYNLASIAFCNERLS